MDESRRFGSPVCFLTGGGESVETKQILDQLAWHVRDGEGMACPYPVSEGAARGLAAFTFYSETEQETGTIIVYELAQKLCFLNGEVTCTELQEEDLEIRIADSPSLLEEEYEQRYQKYYEVLDAYLHDGITQGIAEAFRNIVSPDALEMYRKVCPEFVERFFA